MKFYSFLTSENENGLAKSPVKPSVEKFKENNASSSSKSQLEEILSKGPPFPQAVSPSSCNYWIELEENDGFGVESNTGPNIRRSPVLRGLEPPPRTRRSQGFKSPIDSPERNSRDSVYKIEKNESALIFRRCFLDKEHFNFFGVDDKSGPVVLSCRKETVSSQPLTRVILRHSGGNHFFTVGANEPSYTPLQLAKKELPDLTLSQFHPVLSPSSSCLIAAYDEHVLVRQFKFGVVYQKAGQVTEEQIFGNRHASPAFEEFLDFIGTKIKLSEHKGFRGGLDTQHGQTGEESVFCNFDNNEIMFHVSTLLPYGEKDSQQLQRKRHVGNDIVAVVFQEENTPFSPDIIASHFLHAFILVQPIEPCAFNTRYRVSVVARKDVPFFGPTLPPSSIFRKGEDFRRFLLTKLINAELAAYKAERFAKLEERTKRSLLTALVEDLREKTNEFLGLPETPESQRSKSFADLVKKMLEKSRSGPRVAASGQSSLDPNSQNQKQPFDSSISSNGTPQSSRSKLSKESLDHGSAGSDNSSLNSNDFDTHPTFYIEDSNCDMKYISLNDQKRCFCSHNSLVNKEDSAPVKLEVMKHEINKLKCEKYDLIRKNTTYQRDLRKLKENDIRLQEELVDTNKEIVRLRGIITNLENNKTKATEGTTEL